MPEPVRIGEATLYTGDVREVLSALPDESVHCIVTSPPYLGFAAGEDMNFNQSKFLNRTFHRVEEIIG